MEARLKDLKFKVKEHDSQLKRLFDKADSLATPLAVKEAA